ncbi:hypothetical protein [Oceanithermus sp.]
MGKFKLWHLGLLALLLAFSGCGLVDELTGDEELVVEIPRGGAVTQSVTVELPNPETGELAADVMWLVDLSGSFYDDLDNWRTQTQAIAEALDAVVPNFRVALSSFVDAPCGDFGDPESGDYGYRLELAFSDDIEAFSQKVDELAVASGLDEPESQLEAMYQAMTGAGRSVSGDCAGASIPVTYPDWGSERLRFLLVSTDASFHTPEDLGYPYPTTAEDVIATAEREGVRIVFMNSGSVDPAAETIAEATGGAVFDVGSDSAELVDAIREAVSGAVTDAVVRLVPVGDEGLVQEISPSEQRVDLRETRSITFQVTFTDSGVSADEVHFVLELRVNGSLIAEIPVRVVLR